MILLIFLIPLTRLIVGTAIGVKGAIVPLVFGATPFFTRQVEAALANVSPGKVEAPPPWAAERSASSSEFVSMRRRTDHH